MRSPNGWRDRQFHLGWSLDEIQFFNGALSQLEIQAIYDAGSEGKCIDLTPEPIAFTDVTGAELSTLYTSNAITVAGLGFNAPISVIGGQYSINGGAYTSTMGTVANGNTVTVQQTSSPILSTITNAVLTIGTVSDTYSVTTKAAPDTTPDPFTFNAQTNIALSAVITSNTITVSGINTASAISISASRR